MNAVTQVSGRVLFPELLRVSQHDRLVVSQRSVILVVMPNGDVEHTKVPYGARLLVNAGDTVKPGQVLATWDENTIPIIAECHGTTTYIDLIEGVSCALQVDEVTGLTSYVVIHRKRHAPADRRPRVLIEATDALFSVCTKVLPVGTIICVTPNTIVTPGTVIARVPVNAPQYPGSQTAAARLEDF